MNKENFHGQLQASPVVLESKKRLQPLSKWVSANSNNFPFIYIVAVLSYTYACSTNYQPPIQADFLN